jgi:hypothetical protein
MLDERDDAIDNESIEEVDNVQTDDVVANRVGFKGVESTLVTLKQFPEQDPIDITPLVQSIRTIQKEMGFGCAQESYQTILESFFP